MRASPGEVSWSRASTLHPLASTAYLLILLSSITILYDWADVAVIFMASSLMALRISSPRRVLSSMAFFLPMALGLGFFAYLVSGGRDVGMLLLVFFRVETAVAGSILYAYSSDPWEFADSLIKVGVPVMVSYTVALAYNMLQGMLRDLQEILQSLKSRRIIPTWFHVVPRLPLLVQILIQVAARRAEELQIALEARRFDPYNRRSWRRVYMTFGDLIPPIVVLILFAVSLS